MTIFIGKRKHRETIRLATQQFNKQQLILARSAATGIESFIADIDDDLLALSNFPVVLMTAYSHDKLVKDGLEEGAIAALTKPLDINALLSFFSTLRKEQSIVIVDDDPQFCKTLGDILRARSFTVIEVTDPKDVMETLKRDSQVVLLDMKINDISGLDVLKEIREHYPYLPVILVTGYREEMAQAIEAAQKVKAYACLYKPFQIEELLQLLTEISHQGLAHILGQPVRKRK